MKMLLSHKTRICAANLLEVASLTLKGGARHQFINPEQQNTYACFILARVMRAHNISPKHGGAVSTRNDLYIGIHACGECV